MPIITIQITLFVLAVILSYINLKKQSRFYEILKSHSYLEKSYVETFKNKKITGDLPDNHTIKSNKTQ